MKPLDLTTDKFSLVLDFAQGAVLTIRGNIAIPSPAGLLAPFLTQVHETVLARRASFLRIDICALEFINSSSIRPLIDWVWQVRSLPEAQRYRLTFVHDPARVWQKRFVTAQSYFAPELIELEARA